MGKTKEKEMNDKDRQQLAKYCKTVETIGNKSNKNKQAADKLKKALCKALESQNKKLEAQQQQLNKQNKKLKTQEQQLNKQGEKLKTQGQQINTQKTYSRGVELLGVCIDRLQTIINDKFVKLFESQNSNTLWEIQFKNAQLGFDLAQANFDKHKVILETRIKKVNADRKFYNSMINVAFQLGIAAAGGGIVGGLAASKLNALGAKLGKAMQEATADAAKKGIEMRASNFIPQFTMIKLGWKPSKGLKGVIGESHIKILESLNKTQSEYIMWTKAAVNLHKKLVTMKANVVKHKVVLAEAKILQVSNEIEVFVKTITDAFKAINKFKGPKISGSKSRFASLFEQLMWVSCLKNALLAYKEASGGKMEADFRKFTEKINLVAFLPIEEDKGEKIPTMIPQDKKPVDRIWPLPDDFGVSLEKGMLDRIIKNATDRNKLAAKPNAQIKALFSN
ncbi:MAG: hypothetical protein GY810_14130 [Aureispira sp.]|nr:hypothetical protein [Aureispira sp.]